MQRLDAGGGAVALASQSPGRSVHETGFHGERYMALLLDGVGRGRDSLFHFVRHGTWQARRGSISSRRPLLQSVLKVAAGLRNNDSSVTALLCLPD